MTRRSRLVLLELWLPVLLVSLWWLASRDSTSTFFPPLSDILVRTRELWLFEHARSDLLPSLRNLALGYGIALVLGVTGGLLLGLAGRAERALAPLLELFRALPAVALLPLALLLFGVGSRMAIAVIAFGSLWPILLNTIDGVRSVEPVLLDVARSFRLSRRHHLATVVLRSASPQIFAGARAALSIAVVLVVVSELVGSSEGVGNFVLTAQRTFAITDMWTGMVVLGLVGYLLNVGFRMGEARALHWHPSRRGGS